MVIFTEWYMYVYIYTLKWISTTEVFKHMFQHIKQYTL